MSREGFVRINGSYIASLFHLFINGVNNGQVTKWRVLLLPFFEGIY